jgi:hypothetical protein
MADVIAERRKVLTILLKTYLLFEREMEITSLQNVN